MFHYRRLFGLKAHHKELMRIIFMHFILLVEHSFPGIASCKQRYPPHGVPRAGSIGYTHDVLMSKASTKLIKVFCSGITPQKGFRLVAAKYSQLPPEEKVTGLNSVNRIMRFREANLARREQRGESLCDQHTLLNFSEL
jgi:hypothetical protein